MLAIYKRELKSYLTSMTGWVFMACILIFVGVYFYLYNMFYGYPYFSYALTGTLFIFMLVIPVLTMRSFAEERRSKTDQLLLTAPVSVPQIVLGKFLAMCTIFAITCLIACLCPIIIKAYGNSYFATDYASIFLYFLLGCTYISIGMFLSSLTESQIIAAVTSYAVLILLYLVNSLAKVVSNTAITSLIGFVIIVIAIALIYYALARNWFGSLVIASVGVIALSLLYFFTPGIFENALPNLLSELSLTTGFQGTAYYSVLSIAFIVRYISVTFFFCFLTVQSIQKRRWS